MVKLYYCVPFFINCFEAKREDFPIHPRRSRAKCKGLETFGGAAATHKLTMFGNKFETEKFNIFF